MTILLGFAERQIENSRWRASDKTSSTIKTSSTMKHLKDFIFCDGVISSRTVFYLVTVGTSEKDQRALRFVAKLARSPNFFFQSHDAQTQAFIENCAKSIFHKSDIPGALKLLRRQFVSICWLASFLRKFHPALLNSEKISCPENQVKTCPSQSVNVEKPKYHANNKQQRRTAKRSS